MEEIKTKIGQIKCAKKIHKKPHKIEKKNTICLQVDKNCVLLLWRIDLFFLIFVCLMCFVVVLFL